MLLSSLQCCPCLFYLLVLRFVGKKLIKRLSDFLFICGFGILSFHAPGIIWFWFCYVRGHSPQFTFSVNIAIKITTHRIKHQKCIYKVIWLFEKKFQQKSQFRSLTWAWVLCILTSKRVLRMPFAGRKKNCFCVSWPEL